MPREAEAGRAEAATAALEEELAELRSALADERAAAAAWRSSAVAASAAGEGGQAAGSRREAMISPGELPGDLDPAAVGELLPSAWLQAKRVLALERARAAQAAELEALEARLASLPTAPGRPAAGDTAARPAPTAAAAGLADESAGAEADTVSAAAAAAEEGAMAPTRLAGLAGAAAGVAELRTALDEAAEIRAGLLQRLFGQAEAVGAAEAEAERQAAEAAAQRQRAAEFGIKDMFHENEKQRLAGLVQERLEHAAACVDAERGERARLEEMLEQVGAEWEQAVQACEKVTQFHQAEVLRYEAEQLQYEAALQRAAAEIDFARAGQGAAETAAAAAEMQTEAVRAASAMADEPDGGQHERGLADEWQDAGAEGEEVDESMEALRREQFKGREHGPEDGGGEFRGAGYGDGGGEDEGFEYPADLGEMHSYGARAPSPSKRSRTPHTEADLEALGASLTRDGGAEGGGEEADGAEMVDR